MKQRESAEEDDYEPYAEREVPYPLSNWETFVHFLKGSLGTGILSMHFGFSLVGLLSGTILTFLVGGFCSYGLQLLMKTEYKLCKRLKTPYLSYPIAMKIAVETGPPKLRWLTIASPYIVNLFLIVYQLGLCTVYIVFISVNIDSLVRHYTSTCWPIRLYMCFVFVGCVSVSFVPDLKYLTPFSLAANLMIFVSLGIIYYYVFQNMPSPADRHLVLPVAGLMRFIGICFFALESVGVVVETEEHMKTPKSFGGVFGVLNLAIMSVTFLYWLTGFMGYIKYGSDSKGTISLNLPFGVLTNVCRCFLTTGIFFSFALQLYPAFGILWELYVEPRCKDKPWRTQYLYSLALKAGCGVVSFIFALASDNRIEMVLGLLGILCISMLGFTFPAFMHLCVFWSETYGRYHWMLWKDLAIVLGGFIIMVIGCIMTVRESMDQENVSEAC